MPTQGVWVGGRVFKGLAYAEVAYAPLCWGSSSTLRVRTYATRPSRRRVQPTLMGAGGIQGARWEGVLKEP